MQLHDLAAKAVVLQLSKTNRNSMFV